MLVALIAPVFATWPQLRSAQRTAPYVPLGAFLGSGGEGVARLGPFERWLGSTVTVGRTYLPGDDWDDIEGPRELLAVWARWKEADPRRMLVVNVPMMAPNETWLPRPVLASLLRAGARGVFDGHYRALARRLVSAGAGDAVLVPGWEMNGEAYAGPVRARSGGVEDLLAADRRRDARRPGHAPAFRLRAVAGAGRDSVDAVLSGRRRRRHHRIGQLRPAGGKVLPKFRGRAVRTARPRGFRRRARQAHLVPRMGVVPQFRQPGICPRNA
ncbi:hypothetical protein LUX32_26350 [Actinomadura madurae]|nr:hypothetical protein [Actinomadura madurae]MCP9980747.1 hypothetical protein [Actinomadura madurae]